MNTVDTQLNQLFEIFSKDPVFNELIYSLKKNSLYFKKIPHKSALGEIIWWLYKCNVSCQESGLITTDDFILFAKGIYREFIKYC